MICVSTVFCVFGELCVSVEFRVTCVSTLFSVFFVLGKFCVIAYPSCSLCSVYLVSSVCLRSSV